MGGYRIIIIIPVGIIAFDMFRLNFHLLRCLPRVSCSYRVVKEADLQVPLDIITPVTCHL